MGYVTICYMGVYWSAMKRPKLRYPYFIPSKMLDVKVSIPLVQTRGVAHHRQASRQFDARVLLQEFRSRH
jgi:hypothetical protein